MIIKESLHSLLHLILVASLSSFLSIACIINNSENIPQSDATPDNDRQLESFTVTVHYKDIQSQVAIADLKTITFENEEVVRLDSIIEAAALGKETASLYFDFESEDGYRPSSKDNCSGTIPVSGEKLSVGYVIPSSHTLYWDPSMNFPACASVKRLAAIYATETGENPDPSKYEVRVYYYGIKKIIGLETLETHQSGDITYVVLKNIIDATDFSFDLSSIQFDFIATDGFRPSMSGTCKELVPVSSNTLEKGHVDLKGKQLYWDASLGFPKCMVLNDFSQIVVTDIVPKPYTVTVKYNNVDTPINLHEISPQFVQGEALVPIKTFVAEAGIAANLADLNFDFEAGDGYRSGEHASCASLIPMSGSNIDSGYVSQESHRLTWISDKEIPTCLMLKNFTIIHVTDAQ
ncbi:MAG: hypothetical protein V1754_11945 [Pseudomonadota bacterium]